MKSIDLVIGTSMTDQTFPSFTAASNAGQIDFPKRALPDNDIHVAPVDFLIIAGEMFYTRGIAGALETPDETAAICAARKGLR